MATTTFSGPIKAGTIRNTIGTTVGTNVANTGFVTMADVPYQTMVDASKEINKELYQRRYGK